MTGPPVLLLAASYAHRLVLGGETPYAAACEAWNEFGLHGGARQDFIDEVEAAHGVVDGVAP